jgi:hypothetical protein
VEKEPQSQAGEKKAAAFVEAMPAAQESEKGRTPHPHSFQFCQQFRVFAEVQAREKSRDGQLLLTGDEIDPTEMEMMERISRFPADRFEAKGESLLHILLFSGQAITETGEDDGCALISGGFLKMKTGQPGVSIFEGDKASPDQNGLVVMEDLLSSSGVFSVCRIQPSHVLSIPFCFLPLPFPRSRHCPYATPD